MRIVPEISYDEFRKMLDGCFPDEKIDEQVFLNNILKDQFLFATYNTHPSGYLLYDLGSHPARLIQLCVSKGFRSLGIGSFLISQLKKKLNEHEVSEIVLNVDFTNLGAIRFYQEHGFIKDSTNTQYRYHPHNKQNSKTSSLKIHQITKPKLIQEEMHFGDFMTNYICQSLNNQVFVIENQENEIIGHFLYNPEDIKITHFILNNPRIVRELIIPFLHLIPPNTDLIIESLNRNIDRYISQIPGISTTYRLQVMKYNLLTKTAAY